MLENITLESAIKLSTPIAKKLFNDKINPIVFNKISQYLKNKSDKSIFEKESVKYIALSTGQCSTINTIAFPNTPKKLEDLYFPLKIKSENESEIVVNDKANVFEISNKVLVNDTAGMGKSTLLKRIFLNIINEQNHIPVYIELRQLAMQPIAKQIALKFGVSTEFPGKFLSQLPLIYLFDGLDEVSAESKGFIIKEIRKFIDELDNPKILITSRLESYLSEFYDFARYTIVPLKENDAFSLISKYDPNGEISKKLIHGIKRSRDRGLKEFLSTPLYVSLLFCAYRHKTVIPQKKHLFYSQVYEALFESHDLSKEVGFVRPKHSNLDSSEFHTLLRRLGFWCLKNGGKIEFQKDELEIVISEIISNTSGINTSAVNFVKDLTTTVPLFLKEGSNLRWSHKSLMEYFSSMFICNDAKDKQQNLLMYLYQSSDWSTYRNIFELCADIDFSSLRASVVKKVLEAYISHHDSSYKNITNKRIKPIDIEERIGLSFSKNFGFKILESGFSFDADKVFDHMSPDVLTVKNKCESNNNEVSLFFMGLGSGNILVHGIALLGRESMIINVLKHKCPELFFDNKSKIKIERRNTLSTGIINPSIKKNKLYIVSDDPTQVINNSKCFHVINDLLSVVSREVLDFEKVQIELRNIESDSSNGIEQLIGKLV
jgi:hypothetical protein